LQTTGAIHREHATLNDVRLIVVTDDDAIL
jgi:hypothetical protein